MFCQSCGGIQTLPQLRIQKNLQFPGLMMEAKSLKKKTWSIGALKFGYYTNTMLKEVWVLIVWAGCPFALVLIIWSI